MSEKKEKRDTENLWHALEAITAIVNMHANLLADHQETMQRLTDLVEAMLDKKARRKRGKANLAKVKEPTQKK